MNTKRRTVWRGMKLSAHIYGPIFLHVHTSMQM